MSIVLHVIQVLVRLSRSVAFRTILFLADSCTQCADIVGVVISSFWSPVVKARLCVLKRQMPLAGSYLDKFALSSDPTHLKPFVRLRKLYY